MYFIPERINMNISQRNSQRKYTNLIGEFVLKTGLKCFFLKISGIQK